MRDTPTILLVDDNPVNLKVAQMLLRKQNVRVDSVTNGESAVEAIKKKPYQMVLMDIELPGINGLEATKNIRQWEKNRSLSSSHSDHPRPIPIIALTAHDEKETRQACLAAGMDDVMEKPIRSEKIEIALKHIHRNPQTREKTSSRILDALTKTAQSVPVDNPEAAIRHLMTFTLGKEKYAFDMNYIKKICWAKAITPVPTLPPHILGIINTRGEIISVVDLKALLGIQAETPSQASIMITSMKEVDVGFLVDSVDEIIDLPLKSIDPPMITFEKEYVNFIDGEARLDESLVVILNYRKIMASEKMKIHGK